MHMANAAATAGPNDLLTAQEASALLGVKQATLYTYVSRGWLHPVRSAARKDHRYQRDEVESLKLRSTARHGHGALAASAMRWGQPVMDTAITEIDDAGPRYRGHLATDLVSHPGVYENVAELLWTISSMASQRAAVLRAIPSFLEASRTDSPSLRTMRRNLLSVPTLITPARSCPKNRQDMRLTWLRIRREFASDWLSFQNESTV